MICDIVLFPNILFRFSKLGVMEIKKAIDALTVFSRSVPQTLDIMPLHAALTPKEQNSIFAPVRKGVRKIVVATNVAETSITM